MARGRVRQDEQETNKDVFMGQVTVGTTGAQSFPLCLRILQQTLWRTQSSQSSRIQETLPRVSWMMALGHINILALPVTTCESGILLEPEAAFREKQTFNGRQKHWKIWELFMISSSSRGSRKMGYEAINNIFPIQKYLKVNREMFFSSAICTCRNI